MKSVFMVLLAIFSFEANARSSYFRGPLATQAYKAMKVPAESFAATASFAVVPDYRPRVSEKVVLNLKEAPGLICAEELLTQRVPNQGCDPRTPGTCWTLPRTFVGHYCQAVDSMHDRPQDAARLWDLLDVAPTRLSNGVVIKQVGLVRVSMHGQNAHYGVSYTSDSWLDEVVALGAKAEALYQALNVPHRTQSSSDLLEEIKRTESVTCMRRSRVDGGKELPSFIKAVCVHDSLYVE